jgi:hypothetical protein
MLEALVAGETDPARLAALAHPRLAATPERLKEALRGRVARHHRFLLRLHLDQVDALDAAVGRMYLFSDPLVSACTYGAGVISRQG